MKILGYSERGIINSLIFKIGENKKLMNQFIDLISEHNNIDLGKPTDYTILLEQSFSDFGDADLIIIVKYKNPKHKKVLFIEGKVRAQKNSWKIQGEYEKYTKKEKFIGYSSNLFYQLYFKSLLMKHWYEIDKNKEFEVDSNFRNRKIGNNEVVLKAFIKLKECKEAYYIGLIPTKQEEIKVFLKDNEKILEADKDLKLHFLSWETVHKFCEEHKLKKVLKIFKFNKGQIYQPMDKQLEAIGKG